MNSITNQTMLMAVAIMALILAVVGHVDLNRSPVLLVPGFGDSKLEAKFNVDLHSGHECYEQHYQMSKNQSTDGWFLVWKNPKLIEQMAQCWSQIMQIKHNHGALSLASIRPVKFGSIEGIGGEATSPDNYMRPLIEALTQRLGYQSQRDLFAATYDFRYSPDQLIGSAFEVPTRELIETMYRLNGDRPVTIISHSMGCSMMLLFLNRRDEAWRARYVQRWIALAGPYQGTTQSITATLLGHDEKDINMRHLALAGRTFPGATFLYPTWPSSAEGPNENLIVTLDQAFTVETIGTMLYKSNDLRHFARLYQQTRGVAQQVRWLAPKVDTWCLYGHGVPTPKSLIADVSSIQLGQYAKLRYRHKVINGDGDGNVNTKSLRWCKQWSSRQLEKVRVQSFHNVSHFAILTDKKVINFILDRIFGDDVDL